MSEQSRAVLAFDIGGTSFRSALFQNGELSLERKVSSPSFTSVPGAEATDLAEMLLKEIVGVIADVSESVPSLSLIGVSVPGPTDNKGCLLCAPPLWGDAQLNYPLAARIKEESGIEAILFNDLYGSTLWYARNPNYAEGSELFCLFTISTGVGCKIIEPNSGLFVAESNPFAGEVGHMVIDPAPNALLCDCGGRGHLSSYISGRGVASTVRERTRYRGSDEEVLKQWISALDEGGNAERQLIDEMALKFAQALQFLIVVVGIDRVVLVGGLALALGERLILPTLTKLKQLGILGMEDEAIKNLICLGTGGDKPALEGTALYALERANRSRGV